MDSILSPLLSYVLLYKYAAVALIVYAGAVIVPFPVNAMLLAVGAFASQGYINFWIVAVVAVLSNVAGDLTDYGLTRHYGEAVIRKLRLNNIRFFHQLAEELRTDAAVTVFITRFAGSLSPIAALLAGLVSVPFGTFLIYDFLGNAIEPVAALMIGYALGDYWSDFSSTLGLIAAIVAAGIVLFVLARIYHRIARHYTSEDDE